jgi:hypothetical protein
LHQAAGSARLAGENSVRAAEIGRRDLDPSRAGQLARSARCLLELQFDIAQARVLIREANVFAGDAADALYELQLAMGLLAGWDGALGPAIVHLERALVLIQAEGLRWQEYRCLTGLAVANLQGGHRARVMSLSANIAEVAAKLGDAMCPFAMALPAIAELDAGAIGAWSRLEQALTLLREADYKSDLAYALNAAAFHALRDGRIGEADAFAREALGAALAVRRRGEVVFARALLARIGTASRPGHAAVRIQRLLWLARDPDRVGARARRAIEDAAGAAGLPISSPFPTLVPTVMGFDRPHRNRRINP